MFSVADMVVEDEFEDRENENEEEDDSNYVHPTRASLSITKVGYTFIFFVVLSDRCCKLVYWFRGFEHRHDLPRRPLCDREYLILR